MYIEYNTSQHNVHRKIYLYAIINISFNILLNGYIYNHINIYNFNINEYEIYFIFSKLFFFNIVQFFTGGLRQLETLPTDFI